jgi:hypothetical protein
MRSATAIGLAIRAEGHEARPFRDQFTKHFGVWREADAGHNVVFDVIFPRGLRLPSRGEEPLRIVRTYQPAHNIGHFRYLECAQLDASRQPEGEISNWDEILVPFDPEVGSSADATKELVRRYSAPQHQRIEELYTCDASGDVRVKIHNTLTDQTQEYRLGRWSKNQGAKQARRRGSAG